MGVLSTVRHWLEDRRDFFVILLVLISAAWTTVTAHNDGNTAKEGKHLAVVIQEQRVESIGASCIEQNARHDHTVKALDKVLHKAERHLPRAARAQVHQSRDATILLIDALAPVQDCEARIKRFAATASGTADTLRVTSTRRRFP